MSNHERAMTPRNEQLAAQVPDPEVRAKARRRQYSAEYKRRILAEVDECRQDGQIGALLRREGLYSSHLTNWRRQREQGALQGLSPKTRGHTAEPQTAHIVALRRENERLQNELQRAETIIDVQKKLSELLGPSSRPEPSDGSR